ncbi:vWA domain-containing protein [Kitasatospora sp. NBC_01539]|uniref:vWA domain-containing protein n=1 Tax=Kitasatospora sp. NBC_01539 TaxID=2903577 RepID=UPI0038602E56
MSEALMTSHSHRLRTVPVGGPLYGQRIGVAPAGLPPGTGPDGLPALLGLAGAGESFQAAVRLVPVAEVPPGVLAVNAALAAELDLTGDGPEPPWRLDAVPVVPAARIRLEAPTEAPLETALRDVSDAGLPGRLVWVPPGGAGDLWLDVGGLPYRIQQLDTGTGGPVLAEIGTGTEAELFAPGARTGVDIVVLADCSGSMGVDDIPAAGETGGLRGLFGRGARAPVQRRDAALRDALQHLLAMRLQISGRVSRLALVAFTHTTRQVFPRGGGMAELDAGSVATADEFRMAVSLLRPENAGTDIGNALHEAANLLYRHGRPGNEKLIVLVSDGAHWAPRGDQGLGEVVYAAQEPVSLMEHLHRDTGVRLHALGISTPQLYRQWLHRGGQDGFGLEPNHTLLEQLVRVGGGGAAAVGGFDVLAEYFTGLGAGIAQRVQLRHPSAQHGPLPPASVATLQALRVQQDRVGPAGAPGAAAAWDVLADRLLDAAGLCNREARRVCGAGLFTADHVRTAVSRSVRTGAARPDARAFVRDVAAAFRPRRPARTPDLPGRRITAVEGLLDRLREPGARPEDDAWRLEWLGRLADALDELAGRLADSAAAAPVPPPPAVRPAVPPTAPATAPDTAYGVPQGGAAATETGPVAAGTGPAATDLAPAAAAPTAAPVPVSAVSTTGGGFGLRYRGDE